MSGPKVGDKAPDFTLPGMQLVDGTRLDDKYSVANRSRLGPLVLAFYPGDDQMTCTKQMCDYTRALAEFEGLDTEIWGISPQDLDSHERFARKYDLRQPLLSDTTREVCALYGAVRLGGLRIARSTYVIDRRGIIRFVHQSTIGLTYDAPAKLTGVIAALA